MYVTGRGTTGLGTVLPALAQLSRTVEIEKVVVVATKADAGVEQAAAAVNRALGTKLSVEYRVRRATILESIAGLAIDCAIVSVPDHLHFEIASDLMRAGIHCLIVKPLTPTLAEARELVDLQEECGLHCAVEFHKRFDEQNLLVRQFLRDGRLGRPLYMVVAYSQRIGLPLETFRAWADRTNIFQYLGVHYADLIHFLTGLAPVRVSAVGTRGTLDALGVRTWDSVHATVEWEGGFVAQLAIGWVDPPGTSALSDQRFLLVGSQGRFDLDQKDRGVTLATPLGVETPNPHFSMILDGVFQGYGFKSIERWLLDVRDVISGRTSVADLVHTRPSLRQALVSTSVVEAVNRSLANDGAWTVIHDAT
jgi:predicted dehydrogenase